MHATDKTRERTNGKRVTELWELYKRSFFSFFQRFQTASCKLTSWCLPASPAMATISKEQKTENFKCQMLSFFCFVARLRFSAPKYYAKDDTEDWQNYRFRAPLTLTLSLFIEVCGKLYENLQRFHVFDLTGNICSTQIILYSSLRFKL